MKHVKPYLVTLPDDDSAAASAPSADLKRNFGIVPVTALDNPTSTESAVKLIDRIRFQLLGGLIFCGVLPAVVRTWLTGASLYTPSIFNAAALACLAIIVGYCVYRSTRTFPGAAPSTFALSTFATTFALAMLIPLFLRVEYSNIQLVSHFVLTMLFYGVVARTSGASNKLTFAVIPGGTVERLPNLPNVSWHMIGSPGAQVGSVDGVVADLDTDHPSGWDAAMTRFLMAGLPVYHWKQLIEQLCGTVEVEHLSENHLGALNPDSVYLRLKEAMDFVMALAAIVLLSPLMLLIGLMIRLDSKGPAIFRQQRTGFRAQVITVYKFRTMRYEDHAAADDAKRIDLAITREADSRITRVGKFLRKTRLDELPQLFNVLKLEMSLVGPRPEVVPLTMWYEREIPFYHYRHIIKPGITGWAQVNQGHVSGIEDTKRKLSYDFYYAKNCSFWLDCMIMARTISVAFSFFGAR